MEANREDGEAIRRTIYACDVGTTRPQRDGFPSFAWARIDPQLAPLCVETHYEIECLIGSITADIEAGNVALPVDDRYRSAELPEVELDLGELWRQVDRDLPRPR